MHMDPATVQASVMSWIAVIVAVATALIGGGFTIYSVFKAKVAEAQALNNKERLDAHADKIDTLMLHATPPGQSVNVGQMVSDTPPIGGNEENSNA